VTGEIVINRDVQHPSSFLHNLNSSKAFPPIKMVSISTLGAFLAEDNAYKNASSVHELYRIATELAATVLIAANNIVIWLKVYRLMLHMDFGMNSARNRILMSSFTNPISSSLLNKTTEELVQTTRHKPINPTTRNLNVWISSFLRIFHMLLEILFEIYR